MWWGWNGHSDGRGSFNWWIPLLIIGLFIMSSRGGSWLIWPMLFFVVPWVIRLINSAVSQSQNNQSDYKRKHEDVVIVDKPKREPQYMVGDDGELVEVYEEDTYEQKPKRRQSREDDLEYF